MSGPSLFIHPPHEPGVTWAHVERVLEQHDIVTGVLLAALSGMARTEAHNALAVFCKRGLLARLARGQYVRGRQPARSAAVCQAIAFGGRRCTRYALKSDRTVCSVHRERQAEVPS